MSPREASLIEELQDRFGIRLEAGQIEAMERYWDLLAKWNRRLSLTSVKSYRELLEFHFFEGFLAAGRLLRADERCLADIGSGAGLPGLVFALFEPSLDVRLLESNHRKCVFLTQAARTCGLKGRVFPGRAEDYPGWDEVKAASVRALKTSPVLERILRERRIPLLALHEAMQEHTVTVAGEEHRLSLPFLVLATQNPLEMDGTYPLPEAQLDRFFLKLQVNFPSFEDLSVIIDRTTQRQELLPEPVLTSGDILEAQKFVRDVPIASHVRDYAVRLVLGTHPQTPQAPDLISRYVRYGSSPRGVQGLVLAGKVRALFDGRFNVSFDDIRSVAVPCLRHRLILNFEGEAEGIESADLIQEVLQQIPEQSSREASLPV